MSGRYKFYDEADKVTSHSFSRTVLEYPLGRRVGADSVMSESLGALYGRAVTPPSPGPAALRLHHQQTGDYLDYLGKKMFA